MTSTLDFSSKESPSISQKPQVHATKGLPPTNSILILWFPQSLMELPLKQVCLPKKCLNDTSNSYDLSSSNQVVGCVLTMCHEFYRWFICIQSPEEVSYLNFTLGEVKAHREMELRPQEGVEQRLKFRSHSKAYAQINILLNLPEKTQFILKGRPPNKGEKRSHGKLSSTALKLLFSNGKAKDQFGRVDAWHLPKKCHCQGALHLT